MPKYAARVGAAEKNADAHNHFPVPSYPCVACCLIQLSMSARENRHAPPTLKAGILLAAASLYIVLSVTLRKSATCLMVRISPSLAVVDIAMANIVKIRQDSANLSS